MNSPIFLGALFCLVCAAVYPLWVRWMTKRHLGQRIQEYTPEHRTKAGTPTMGGVIICCALIIGSVVFAWNRPAAIAIFAVASGMALGMLDDVENIIGIGSLGLAWNKKLVGQIVPGACIGIGLLMSGFDTQWIPGFGLVSLGWWIIPIALVAALAASNAVNLTDGIDGLCGTTSAIVFLVLAVLAASLHMPAVERIAAIALGSTIAFLLFNWNPARIFLGDTGALAIGFLVVALMGELHLLLLLPIVGIVFVIETLSVIINVTAVVKFKRRIIRASPLHHHFQLGGMSEPAIVGVFSVLGVCGAALTLILGMGLHV